MKKEICIILTVVLLLGQTACSKHEVMPSSGQDFAEQDSEIVKDAFNAERAELQNLYKVPSVTKASITRRLSEYNNVSEYYEIDLSNASASFTDSNQAAETYFLSSSQVEQLCQLLSEYTLTVYDDQPYWPTGEYCTMIELFDYRVNYDGGSYREYGATHYPKGWDDFIQNLKGLIISGEAVREYTYEITTRVRGDMPEYRYTATGIATGMDEWSTGFITKLRVCDENNSPLLYISFAGNGIGNPIFYNMMDTMGLHVVDVNFDGYKDVIILNSFSGAHSNTWYDCWLWNAENSAFAYSSSFADICNPAIDREEQCIYSSGGSGADIHSYNIYRFINHDFSIANSLYWTHSVRVESSGEGETDVIAVEGVNLKEEQLVNGRMETIHDGFFPNEVADDLLAQYKSKEPWQLDSPRWYMLGGHHADSWLE